MHGTGDTMAIRYNFTLKRWESMSDLTKIEIVTRILEIEGKNYMANIINESELDSKKVHIIVNKLLDLGAFRIDWRKIDNKWFKYITTNCTTRCHIEQVLREWML